MYSTYPESRMSIWRTANIPSAQKLQGALPQCQAPSIHTDVIYKPPCWAGEVVHATITDVFFVRLGKGQRCILNYPYPSNTAQKSVTNTQRILTCARTKWWLSFLLTLFHNVAIISITIVIIPKVIHFISTTIIYSSVLGQ